MALHRIIYCIKKFAVPKVKVASIQRIQYCLLSACPATFVSARFLHICMQYNAIARTAEFYQFCDIIDAMCNLQNHLTFVHNFSSCGSDVGIRVEVFSEVAWPSGLRRWFKAPVSSGARVRISPLPAVIFFSLFCILALIVDSGRGRSLIFGIIIFRTR